MSKKERLDQILVNQGYFETKSKAQAAIMAANVKVNGETVTKSGFQLELKEDTQIEIKSMPFVSRGGFKLDKAVKTFGINLSDKICLDAGASTGGFTDCMLQNRAKKVYSVDVGYGQIAWSIRTNDKVKVVERTNIKNCELSDIYDENDVLPSFCAMDLSFISILKVLPNIKKLMQKQNIEIIALIKPQFEAGKDQIGKNGVVKSDKIHLEIINRIIESVCELKLFVKALTFSPIKGPKGNIEYLIYLSDEQSDFSLDMVNKIVEEAFESLN